MLFYSEFQSIYIVVNLRVVTDKYKNDPVYDLPGVKFLEIINQFGFMFVGGKSVVSYLYINVYKLSSVFFRLFINYMQLCVKFLLFKTEVRLIEYYSLILAT